jgi:hypothetical protein
LRILAISFEGITERTEEKKITFKDLALLHRIAPNQFKNLTITRWDSENRETLYFDVQNTPNMPIAYAARISISLPTFFNTCA